jgi:GAF domain-containing protein
MMITDYDLLINQLKSLAQTEQNYVSMMANASALLMEAMEQVNWAGFYLVREGCLKVGPFQGKPACVLISKGKGVCGTAWERDETVVVPNVHDFPGHIACDSASRSEIVVPIHNRNEVAAVLDIDSPLTARFSEEDRQGLEMFVRTMEEMIIW